MLRRRRRFGLLGHASGGGVAHRSFAFDGVNERINGPTWATVTGGMAATWCLGASFWINPDTVSPASRKGIIGSSSLAGSNWTVRLTTAGKIQFGHNNAFTITSSASLTAGVWQHVAVEFYCDFGGWTGRTHINGSFGSYPAQAGPYLDGTGYFTGGQVFQVGACTGEGSSFLAGKIKNVGLWYKGAATSIFTSDQITAIYAAKNDPDYSAVTGLKLWWMGTADDDLTTSNGVLDSSAAGTNDGTGSNMEAADLSEDVPT